MPATRSRLSAILPRASANAPPADCPEESTLPLPSTLCLDTSMLYVAEDSPSRDERYMLPVPRISHSALMSG